MNYLWKVTGIAALLGLGAVLTIRWLGHEQPAPVCRLHNSVMTQDVAYISYGLFAVDKERETARLSFSNANSYLMGGCFDYSSTAPYGKTFFCAECRVAEKQWRAAEDEAKRRRLHQLIETVDSMNATNEVGVPLIVEAARYGDVALLKRVLALGGDLNAAEQNGLPPLFHAVLFENETAIRMLLAAGANVNYRTEHGDSPLHFAAQEAPLGLISLLVAKGADINAKNRKGETPLEIARARNKDLEVIHYLILHAQRP